MQYFVCTAGVYIEEVGLGTLRGTQMGLFFVWALINDHFWIFFIYALNKRNI